MKRPRMVAMALFLASAAACAAMAAAEQRPPARAGDAAPAKKRVLSIDEVYRDYKPDFLDGKRMGRLAPPRPPAKKMMLSSEPTFYSQCFVHVEARANALLKAGLEAEEKGDYRRALALYQQVIDRFPNALHRISKYGVFVPVRHYCQLRILNFPPDHLAFYRLKHDARAREAFELSERNFSEDWLAHIRDNMLCTSYGSKAMLLLGDAELDRGHYLGALEYFSTVRKYFPEKKVHTPELKLKTAFCRKMLGEKVKLDDKLTSNQENGRLGAEKLKTFLKYARENQPPPPGLVRQHFSPSCVTADDYMHMPPTTDPLGLKKPVWSKPKGGGGLTVDTQPVVTDRSVIYRHLNRVYCRSILNGELRWKNELGGRVSWESRYRNHREDILVHEGMVFTAMYKNGPSLAALDETTGQLKWSYGPMSASTVEQAFTRFMTAPAGGPGTVFAGYVLDNMASGAHADSEYGIIAFESATGRIKWRRKLCQLRPGKFASLAFDTGIRNRIRSFASPPTYHHGTVYYCTNAGAVAALDALSGQVKWLTKYPYHSYPRDIHDATRVFGKGYTASNHPFGEGLWMNQPPLIVGDDLYVLPVDSMYMLKIDRRNGKTHWTQARPNFLATTQPGNQFVHFLGPIRTGELLFTFDMRESGWLYEKGRGKYSHCRPGQICLVSPDTGKVVWWSREAVPRERKHPGLYLRRFRLPDWGHTQTIGMNHLWFHATARPFLCSDNRLYLSNVALGRGPGRALGPISNVAVLDLNKRAFTDQHRRYLSGEIISQCRDVLTRTPSGLKEMLSQPKHVLKHKDVRETIRKLKLLARDTVPVNEHPPFLPFSRLTFRKYGITFELRVAPGHISMLYDREHVKRLVTAGKEPEDRFAASELAVGESRFADAARLMEACLASMSPEDQDFRAVVNQQLYRVYRKLARGRIRMRDPKKELETVIGMSRTTTSLDDEIQALFALSEAYERDGQYARASDYLRSLVSRYGAYHYGVPSLHTRDRGAVRQAWQDVLKRSRLMVKGMRFEGFLAQNMALMGQSLSLYGGALSPSARDLRIRTEQVAVDKLIALQAARPAFKAAFEKMARAAFEGKPAAERQKRLMEFPGTGAGQAVLKGLLEAADKDLRESGDDASKAAAARKRLWRLADTARVCEWSVPEALKSRLHAAPAKRSAALTFPLKERELDMEDARSTAWLALERRGRREVRPELLFLGGRVRKKLDNKFVLHAIDTRTGKTAWKATERRGDRWFEELRLKGLGHEPGFSEAMVCGDLVVVHGLFDVLAFGLADGRLRWRYRVPFNFEISHALLSGKLLMLAGENATQVLYVPTREPAGELVWQEREQGDLYGAPYVDGDRLVSVRKMPFNVTVRYRTTGRLVGRLDLDGLTLRTDHPLMNTAPRAHPMSHDGRLLALCGSGYYLMIDTAALRVVWKRLMDRGANTAVRLELNGDYLAVTKKDFDLESIYMLSSKTGKVLWRSLPKEPGKRVPVYSMLIREGKLYGLRKHPGQGFYFVGVDCETGKDLFRPCDVQGYAARPVARLKRALHGHAVAVEVKDRLDFELIGFDARTGKLTRRMKVKGAGDFGKHGRASATVQNGCMVLHGTNTVKIAAPGN